jgi:hypothetical protein
LKNARAILVPVHAHNLNILKELLGSSIYYIINHVLLIHLTLEGWGKLKQRKFSTLIKEEKVEFVVIQETKLDYINSQFCNRIRECGECELVAKDCDGRSGWLLSLLISNIFSLRFKFEWEGFLGVCLEMKHLNL